MSETKHEVELLVKALRKKLKYTDEKPVLPWSDVAREILKLRKSRKGEEGDKVDLKILKSLAQKIKRVLSKSSKTRDSKLFDDLSVVAGVGTNTGVAISSGRNSRPVLSWLASNKSSRDDYLNSDLGIDSDSQAFEKLKAEVRSAHAAGNLIVKKARIEKIGNSRRRFCVETPSAQAVCNYAAQALVDEATNWLIDNKTGMYGIGVGLGLTTKTVIKIFANELIEMDRPDFIKRLRFIQLAQSLSLNWDVNENVPSLFVQQAFGNYIGEITQNLVTPAIAKDLDATWLYERMHMTITSISEFEDPHSVFAQHVKSCFETKKRGLEVVDKLKELGVVGVMQCWPFRTAGFLPDKELKRLGIPMPLSCVSSKFMRRFASDPDKFACMVVADCPHKECTNTKAKALDAMVNEKKLWAFNRLYTFS